MNLTSHAEVHCYQFTDIEIHEKAGRRWFSTCMIPTNTLHGVNECVLISMTDLAGAIDF